MNMKTPAAVAQQSEAILQLIRNARQLDRQGKMKPARRELIKARMAVAAAVGDEITLEVAANEVDNARARVRRAANKAEEKLQDLISTATLWQWTDPDRAIRELRLRHFGGYDHLPLTDIEEGLKDAGNVLFIVAVYPALQGAILKRLGEAMRQARDGSEES